jgi:hypothetical protein
LELPPYVERASGSILPERGVVYTKAVPKCKEKIGPETAPAGGRKIYFFLKFPDLDDDPEDLEFDEPEPAEDAGRPDPDDPPERGAL